MSPAPAANIPEWTVSELSASLKKTVEDAYGYVRVRGEISGYRGPHSSGHCYFALKDQSAKIEAVIWKGIFGRMRIKPEEGLEVIASGRLTTFPGQSKYQIVIESLEPAGLGALMALLEERKKKLAAEGLFDEARKQLLPYLPEVIGVVTSPTGAVIRDILHRLADRFPRRVIVWPVRVQGEGSAEEVAAAIRGFNALPETGPLPRPDLLIVARGGGIAGGPLVVQRGDRGARRGRQPDPADLRRRPRDRLTLIDFASDKRAPTPTAAAEIAVPVRAELLAQIDSLARRNFGSWQRCQETRRAELRSAMRALPSAEEILAIPRQRLDHAGERLPRALTANAHVHRAQLTRATARLTPQLLRTRLTRESERLVAFGGRATLASGNLVARRRERWNAAASRLVVALRNYARGASHPHRPRARARAGFSGTRRARHANAVGATRPPSRPRRAAARGAVASRRAGARLCAHPRRERQTATGRRRDRPGTGTRHRVRRRPCRRHRSKRYRRTVCRPPHDARNAQTRRRRPGQPVLGAQGGPRRDDADNAVRRQPFPSPTKWGYFLSRVPQIQKKSSTRGAQEGKFMTSKHPETIVLHAGYRADPTTTAVAVPIYQTTSYQFHDTEHAANLFALKELGNIYTRIMNPTCDVLEQRVAALEGGVAALARGLGTGGLAVRGAEHLPGRRQHRQLDRPLWRHLESVRQHAEDHGHRGAASSIRPIRRTSAAPPTPRPAATTPRPCPTRSWRCSRSRRSPRIGRELGVPLIMDNTAAPVLCRPFEHGAAIVMHSTTKYIGGHGTSIGGIIVDGGNFDWEKHADRFPMLNTPDPSYHGAVWTQAVKPLGPIAYIIKARVTLLRDLGAAMTPFNAFMFMQGLETLPLRMQRHCANAETVADYLAQAPEGHQGDLPRPDDRRGQAPRRRLSQGRLRRPGRLRAQGRQGGRPPLHRCAADVLPRRQYRRRALARDPSGDHHALAIARARSRCRPASPTAMSGCRSASSTSTTSSPISTRRWRRCSASQPHQQ